MLNRILKPSKSRSFFLFGPRQTGKSTYVRNLLRPQDIYINLLPQRTYLAYSRNPGIFRQEILSHQKRHGNDFICVVDEIQKIPGLLDEIHDLIESEGILFILTGSSARKLRHGAANLLAGRANTYALYPLTIEELGDVFELERALQRGLLPFLWSGQCALEDEKEFLRAYTETYLKEEIQAEGIVRNIAPFARFLDIAANNDGEIVNYSNIARECGVSVKTVQEYYRILEDTFLAHRIEPWSKSIRKRLVANPRYYLFDTGITNALCHYYDSLNTVVRGRRFEQFIILQMIAWNDYHRLGWQFFFWRTHTGVEVDLIITKEQQPFMAVEIKSSPLLGRSESHGLQEFCKEYAVPAYIVCTAERRRLLENGIQVIPWQDFFKDELARFHMQGN